MTDVEQFGRALLQAARSGVPIAPPTQQQPGLTIEDAYAIQRFGRDAQVALGAEIVGHKIGLTSAAMQEMLGVDQPDFGYLTASMVSRSGVELPVDAFIAPRVEIEVAFRLRASLQGPDVTVAEVLAATEAVAPAIEVIDSRIADWRLTIADTVADNASSGHVVLGQWRTPEGLDLAAVQGALTVQPSTGEPETAHGRGDAVLGHPASAVAWLARALDAFGGIQLAAGEIVLSGALARALVVGRGSVARGHIEALGDVSVTFT